MILIFTNLINEVYKEEYNRNTGENCQEYVMEVVKTYIDNY